MDAFYRYLKRSRLAGVLLLSALLLMPASVAWAAELDAAHAKQRIEVLRTEVAHHDELYFKQAAPEISDHAYDQLKRELQHLEQLYPDYARAPDAQVGDDRTGAFPEWHHGVPMLSLNKSYDQGELQTFCQRVKQRLGRDDLAWVLEPKYDGLAISVTYEHGRLVRAVTRGNGTVGDDVTANVGLIKGLPVLLRRWDETGRTVVVPDKVELRGEVYLTYAEFRRINAAREAAGMEPYAHPRNLAAGTLKQIDPTEVGRRRLSVVFYGWGQWEPAASQPESQVALHHLLRDWGVPGVRRYRLLRDFDEIWASVQEWQQARKQWPFPADGVVLKLDDAELQAKLGAGPAAPNWAMAYKYAPEQASTRVRDIVIQVGRTGLLTPVVVFDPVKLDGTSVARASLHNREYIRRLGLRVGDWVKVEKAGEVIPQVAEVELARRPTGLAPYVFPDHCPECGTAVVAEAGAAVVRCPNPECPAQVRGRLAHFASKAGVNIKGVGPALVDKLVAADLVKTPADIYLLDPEKLATVVSQRKAKRILTAIERSRRAPLWRFIVGLGMPRVGPAAAHHLARHFGSLPALGNVMADALFTPDGSPAIPELGMATTQAVWAYCNDATHRRQIDALVAAGVEPTLTMSNRNGPLAGKVLVLTGNLADMTHAEAKKLIGEAGGVLRSSVSGKTDYLVAGSNGGRKLNDARRFGVKVIDVTELRELIAEPEDAPENDDQPTSDENL